MSENPLLPHAKLRELHAMMLRCRKLERKQGPGGAAREALLAAALAHLLPGDLLSSGEDSVASQLAPEAKKPGMSSVLAADARFAGRLPICAAAARGVQAAGADGVVVAIGVGNASEPGWQAAMTWAQNDHLPLIVVCGDASDGARSRIAKGREALLDYEAISRFSKRTKLPVLTVDGEDAVAVYRVMQESVMRARMGGGPAAVWAVLTPAGHGRPTLKRSATPLARMERYMAARHIAR